MAGRCVRLPLEAIEAGERTLDDSAARYLIKVQRAKSGDSLLVFDPVARTEAEAKLVRLSRRGAVLQVGTPRTASNVPTQPLIVIQGLPKSSKLDAIMRDVTELGATALMATVCERSQPRSLTPAHRTRCLRIATEAARQCGRGDIPSLSVCSSLADAIAGLPPAPDALQRVALHPHASHSFAQLPNATAAAIAIGPEGGFSPAEVAELQAADFALVRLGNFVMRTETAPTAAIGALLSRRG